MSGIEIPKHLDDLLNGSHLHGPIHTFVSAVGTILADNKMPFFPDFTEHGIDHISDVLNTQVELIPRGIWNDNDRTHLLCDLDAVVMIAATLLHDLAMHPLHYFHDSEMFIWCVDARLRRLPSPASIPS